MEIFQDFGYKGEMKKRAILWNHDLDLGGLCKSDLELAWETDDWEKKFICRTRLNSVGRCVMIEESKLYSFSTHTIRIHFHWDLTWKDLILLESISALYSC